MEVYSLFNENIKNKRYDELSLLLKDVKNKSINKETVLHMFLLTKSDFKAFKILLESELFEKLEDIAIKKLINYFLSHNNKKNIVHLLKTHPEIKIPYKEEAPYFDCLLHQVIVKYDMSIEKNKCLFTLLSKSFSLNIKNINNEDFKRCFYEFCYNLSQCESKKSTIKEKHNISCAKNNLYFLINRCFLDLSEKDVISGKTYLELFKELSPSEVYESGISCFFDKEKKILNKHINSEEISTSLKRRL